MFSKKNVSYKLRLTILLVLSAGIILSFAPGATAQPIETWSGPLKFQVKATEFNPLTEKFDKKNKNVTGTLELYTGIEGPPIPNLDGYYMKFIGKDQNNQDVAFGITQLALIDMEVNATTGKFLAVGVGEFYDPNAPGEKWGIVYIDFSGSWKAATSKKPETISMVIKMGGGIDRDVIISANPKVTLTKQP
ncbi:MAG: hypothetical protein FJ134_09225 [Deltaproteobacteria bacterium]|nr:hypothetical protein [Deltaproteobacteria bacterium]